MARRLPVVFAILISVGVGCVPIRPSASKPEAEAPKKQATQKLDVKKAFYKYAKEVDAIFGKPTGSNKIKADASTRGMTPGEFR
jgi:hypothetical protein